MRRVHVVRAGLGGVEGERKESVLESSSTYRSTLDYGTILLHNYGLFYWYWVLDWNGLEVGGRSRSGDIKGKQLTMLRKELASGIPINTDIRIQAERFAAPDFLHCPLSCAGTPVFPSTFPFSLFGEIGGIGHKLPQCRPAPKILSECRILDLEPVVDADGIALFGLARGCD